MRSSRYVIDYAGEFSFLEPPDVVWSAIEDLDQFEHWWGWLGSLTVEGEGLRAGSVLHGTVTPPLPYRMSLRVELDRCLPPSQIDSTVHGDLEGEAHLSLEPDGAGTRADVAWCIEMMQTPMRAAARLAYPALRWGHDRVVDATVRGFRDRLR